MQKFNYHQHTYRCKHAQMDVMDEDYVKEYIKMGFKKVAFTDHCPERNVIDKREKMRMNYDQKEEYLKSINDLKEKYKDKIEIQTGYEVEYLPDDVENIMELKNETDKIILGQHFIYDDTEKELKVVSRDSFSDGELERMASYMEEAMKAGIPDIVAHPDLYMLEKKVFQSIDEKVARKICNAAEKYDIPLEINLNKIFKTLFYEKDKLPKKDLRELLSKSYIYPCQEFWKIASQYNIRVLYGIDVHYAGEIMKWNELVEFANEIIGEDTIRKLRFIEEL